MQRKINIEKPLQLNNDVLIGLGKMYVSDERFKNNIDKHGNGTAEFISESIEYYCVNKQD